LQHHLALELLDLEGDGSLPAGTLIGSYRLISLLSEGGMGRVYVAEHVKLGRRVAVKKLRRELAANPTAVARFFGEARAVNRIFHENIVEITDLIEQPGGDNCIIMELLKGEDLAHRLQRTQTVPLASACGIAAQIASALSAVHAAGMIHRDLKPDNIFLIERGGNPDFVKVLDFGVAKLTNAEDRGGVAMHTTAAGQVIGTPEYMSPEQAKGEVIDFRADIYALGVILYEMVTGVLPVQATSFGELMLKHLTAQVQPPGHQPGLPRGIQIARDQLVLDLLAKDPASRPRSMAEVEQRLRALLDAMIASPRPRSEPTEPARSAVAAKSGADSIAKLALVKRPTPQAAIEISTPRSISRIDVLTPTSIRLDLISRPRTAPPAGEPPQPGAPTPASSAQRLAKSSSDAHVVAEPKPFAVGIGETGRPSSEPAREVIASDTPEHRSGTGATPTGSARARRRLVVAGVAVVALAGAILAFARQRQPGAPPAPPPEIVIKFVSAPPGAAVRLAGTSEPLGVTPFTRSFPRSDRPASFAFEKPGFAAVTQDVPLRTDDAVAVALTPTIMAAPAGPAAVVPPPVPDPSPKATPERPHNAAPVKHPSRPRSDPPLDRNGTLDVFKGK
jgi:eukaryotic-like serine/threonine-protein kinase